MPKAVRVLPEFYRKLDCLELAKNRRLAILFNLAGIVLFFICTGLFASLIAALRLSRQPQGWRFEITAQTLIPALVGLLTITSLTIVVHELIHAACFWYFTRWPATFGFKGLYAYAAAPQWYIPRNQHVIITLAPLTLITAVGMVLVTVVPEPWLPALLVVLVVNSTGAIGDMLTAGWLLTKPKSSYVNDYGDGFAIYAVDSSYGPT